MGLSAVLILLALLAGVLVGASGAPVAETPSLDCAAVQAKWRREDLVRTDAAATELTLSPAELDRLAAQEELPEESLVCLGVQPELPEKSNKRFQGDINGMDESTIHNFLDKSNMGWKSAIDGAYARWPGNTIPYTISSQYGTLGKAAIARAIADFHKFTCLKFVPHDKSSNQNYIFITPDDGCYSYIGRQYSRRGSRQQIVSLDEGCLQKGTAIHELMHSAGFFHEHTRWDRDQYVRIVSENIMRSGRDQFQITSLNEIQDLGISYDYDSVLHYGTYAFSRADGRLRTIVPLRSGGDRIGQRSGFSEKDKQRINALYCPERQQPVIKPKPTTKKPTVRVIHELKPAPTTSSNWRCAVTDARGRLSGDAGYCTKMHINCRLRFFSMICPNKCEAC